VSRESDGDEDPPSHLLQRRLEQDPPYGHVRYPSSHAVESVPQQSTFARTL